MMFKVDLHYGDCGEQRYILKCIATQWEIHEWSYKPSPEEVQEEIDNLRRCCKEIE
jgi:hypothetical protein